ncbi:MAG: mucoidy inhibitor MuiA family protein [Bacteroidales bacterium]|nr:mucoidy inhibitor MuiA family protein [Bacteroidales bacterium]
MKTYSKILLTIILSVSIITTSYSQKNIVKSKISKVTVFQQGAQIYRKANTKIKIGHQIIHLSNLSNNIDINSIQVDGKGKFTIMSVTHQINYLKQIKRNKRIVSLTDSITLYRDKVSDKTQIIRAFQDEINLLRANQSLKSQNVNLKASDIKIAADFYRARFRDIYYQEGKLKRENVKLKKEISNMQKQLNQLQRNNSPKGVGEILVEIESELASNASIEFNYLVQNVGWTPQYDIRAIDIKSKIELHYRANIYQNTGVDWNNVQLTVSTGNPRRNGVMPVLRPWYLRFNNTSTDNEMIEMASDDMDMALKDKSRTAKASYLQSGAMNSANFTTVNKGQINTKFEISLPYTIPSTNKRVSVKIQKWLLDAEYRYYCAPRISEDVFLQARITGWEELSLLPGMVNIFFDGTYVSKTQLNTLHISDTLDISLGADKGIIVKRTKVKNSTSTTIIGSSKKLKVEWDIVVRNNKSQEVNLFLQDQIPVTLLEDVDIKLNEKSGAIYNQKNGFLSWKLSLAPRYKKELNYDYQIKYPKDLIINGIW